MAESEKIFKKIIEAVEKAVEDSYGQNNMQKIVDEAAKIVRRRTLLGYGVSKDGAQRERLKPLSKSYVEQRRGEAVYYTDKAGRVRRVPTGKRFRSRLSLSPKTTPTKSNLTLTGQLLDSLTGFVTGKGRGEVRPVGPRNEEVAGFVEEGGRPFLYLSNNEIRQLEIFSGELLSELVIKNLTKVN